MICSKKILIGIVCFLSLGATKTNAQAMTKGENFQNKSQTQKIESSLTQDKIETVNLWAEALSQRNGAFRFALLSDELKAKEYDEYNQMSWVIGGSSPWVVSYTVHEKNKVDSDTYVYQISYTMTDSTKAMYNSIENITVKRFGNSWCVVGHDNYNCLPDITEDTAHPFSEVQLNKKNSLVTKDKEGTVALWAEALKQRNSSFRFAILSNKLKSQDYEKYKDMNWSIGGSSPWVTDYSFTEKNKIDDNTYVYQIDYTLTDSTQTMYNSHENITVQKFGDNWIVVNHDNYDFMPDITECK
ncbi:MAG: hypothetical protein LKJ13_07660 [Clostridia bacterium]|jgi:bla regulator protein BlaR1|nr:hypothetical protein [Clostridia bacterium]MCI1999107.1 hypothetical protein [Clostridia bacterium]MCI2013857.1 hypothetical protein [Clostridia bacterium]